MEYQDSLHGGRRHAGGSPFIEVFLKFAEADIALLEGEVEAARKHLEAACALEDHMDTEAEVLRDALNALIVADGGQREEAVKRLRVIREAISKTSFAFRFDELLRRAGGD